MTIGRILVIDDDALVAKALTRGLADFEIVALNDARAALERLGRGEHYDAIICDVMMPGMNGAEFHAELHRIGSVHRDRVVFITAGTTTPKARDFVSSVRNPVVQTPFEISAMSALIRQRIQEIA